MLYEAVAAADDRSVVVVEDAWYRWRVRDEMIVSGGVVDVIATERGLNSQIAVLLCCVHYAGHLSLSRTHSNATHGQSPRASAVALLLSLSLMLLARACLGAAPFFGRQSGDLTHF